MTRVGQSRSVARGDHATTGPGQEQNERGATVKTRAAGTRDAASSGPDACGATVPGRPFADN